MDIDDATFERLVQACLESNDDQRDYDRASAMAAVEAMLIEEDGDVAAVASRLGVDVLSGVAPQWTREHQEAAQQEGWDLFQCDAVDHPEFELQTIGAPMDWDNLDYTEPKFVDEKGEVSDIAAWRHVVERAAAGSALHIAALAFLKVNSPEEYDHVITLTPYS